MSSERREDVALMPTSNEGAELVNVHLPVWHAVSAARPTRGERELLPLNIGVPSLRQRLRNVLGNAVADDDDNPRAQPADALGERDDAGFARLSSMRAREPVYWLGCEIF
jgi:hypothetical protein